MPSYLNFKFDFDFVGKSIFNLIHPNDLKKFINEFSQCNFKT